MSGLFSNLMLRLCIVIRLLLFINQNCADAFRLQPEIIARSTSTRLAYCQKTRFVASYLPKTIKRNTFVGFFRLHATQQQEFDEMLEDMMFGGDMEGVIRRKSKEVVSETFATYLVNKLDSLSSAGDDVEEEREVVQIILNNVRDRLRKTDGLGDDSVIQFEKRLDKILFISPKERRTYISEHAEEMTTGFIDYVQGELHSLTDEDSKVVLASILQIIGQTKGADFLGSDSSILRFADESLGEEYKKAVPQLGDAAAGLGNANEHILAGLLFSKNDLVEDIFYNLHIIDEGFISFVQTKIDESRDLEERAALSSLLTTINLVVEKVKACEQYDDNSIEQELSMEEVKQRMKEVQAGQQSFGQEQGTKKNKGKDGKQGDEFNVKQEKKATFESILSRFQLLPADKSLRDVVSQHYDLCDYEFLQLVRQELLDCQQQEAFIEAEFFQQLLDTVQEVMVERMGSAQERLAKVLAKQDPLLMEAEVTAMTRRNEIDEAFVLLLEANAQQARAAGAGQVADLLEKLKKRIFNERDRRLPDDQKLLRQLMRIENSEDRKGLLFQAFKASKTMNEDNEFVDGPPLVTPPVFINMAKSFILNFGNVEGYHLMERAQTIIDEAQVVATELYGEGMTAKDQQRFMFEKQTVSVWDLANFEEQAMMSGEEVPWENNSYDGKGPDEVLGERVRKIGGMQ